MKTTELWVVFNSTDKEINEVYVNKEEAEIIYTDRLKYYYNLYRKHYKTLSNDKYNEYFNSTIKNNCCKVITLSEAFDNIKESFTEQISSLKSCY